MKSRQSIVEQVQEYLKFRRSCGYQLEAPGKELMLFARYASLVGHKGPLTTELAVRWAKLPQDADPRYWAIRYDIVRRFAEYRFFFDPATEIPPKGFLGPSKRRLSPHINFLDYDCHLGAEEFTQFAPRAIVLGDYDRLVIPSDVNSVRTFINIPRAEINTDITPFA